jgi:hypothetical protein
MVEVVEMAVFNGTINNLLKRIERLESQLSHYKEMNPAAEWITRRDAMTYLCIGETKLWELTKLNKVNARRVGSKLIYSVESLRLYLQNSGFSDEYINAREKKALVKK